MEMKKNSKKGKLRVVWGPMFSGKTTYLIENFGQGHGVVVFKPDLEERYTKQPSVVTHDGLKIPAVLVDHRKPSEMKVLVGGAKLVLIDEANFFEPRVLVRTIREFLREGVDVCVDGLALDSELVVWEPMAGLIKMADESVELKAKCDGERGECKAGAVYSYCKIPKKKRIQVAGEEIFGASCAEHYKGLHRRRLKKK